MNRTLVFCTSFAPDQSLWTKRFRVWLNAIQCSEIHCDHILLIDDGSPVLPEWPDTEVRQDLAGPLARGGVTLFHFRQQLGRQGVAIYPGWYRSFCLAARFAEAYSFDKVVHIESDGFIISTRMQHYINCVDDDWVAPAIQSHKMPESAIQIMSGRGFDSYLEFTRKPYSDFVGQEAENVLPLTKVETAFVGSRYGETLRYVPREADFVTQTNPEMRGQSSYYWWLNPECLPF